MLEPGKLTSVMNEVKNMFLSSTGMAIVSQSVTLLRQQFFETKTL
jgi:hypothetical protein